MLSCFENREEGMLLFLMGLLGLVWCWGDSGPQWSCCVAWVTKYNKNWGGTGPLSAQNTALPLTPRMGSFRRVGRQPPLGIDRNVFVMVTAMGRKMNGHLYSSNTGRKRNFTSWAWMSSVHRLKQNHELGLLRLTCLHQQHQWQELAIL